MLSVLFRHGWCVLLGLLAIGTSPAVALPPTSLPNVLWISSEDHGQEMGCYGDTYADTPHVDALAKRGLLYRNVWSNAPVCAPARTTIISGIYPPSLGAEHMRSMVAMAPGTEFFTEKLQQAGYYCTNNSKEDYNVTTPKTLWNESSRQAHYKNRSNEQPFFAVFNSTLSHESAIRSFKGDPQHDPSKAPIPSYHPDTKEIRRDWAIYYDTVTKADAVAGQHLRELESAGLADSTIVFYWGDHGSGMPRHKRWPSDSGLRVPLIVYIPEAFKHLQPADYIAGGQSDRLIGFIDFAPTMLSLADIEPPTWMQGKAFLGRYAAPPQPYLHGFRGRMDERLDLVRSVTDGRFVYIKNYMPHLSQGQHVAYQMETPTTQLWRNLYDQGKLNDSQSRFWTTPKDSEELYDLKSDPDEVNNLVSSSEHAETLTLLRQAHRDQVFRIRDLGFVPEGERRELAGGQPLYAYGHQIRDYPLGKIFDAAQLASAIADRTPQTLRTLVDLTTQQHAALRYWGVMGLRMRGAEAVAENAAELSSLLEDSSPEVRISAAEALAHFGDAMSRDRAMGILISHANWSSHDVFSTMAAVSALESLGSTIAVYADEITQLPAKGKSPHDRYSSYVPRLLQNLKAIINADRAQR